jgi:hypothetical protein
MNKSIVRAGLAPLLLSAGATGFALAQAPPKPPTDDDDKAPTIKLADTPAPVRAAVAKLTAEKNVKQVTTETSHGVTTYEVEYQADGKTSEAELSANGDVLEIVTSLKADALPSAAAAAIAKAFPKATISEAESVQQFSYEVVVTLNGKTVELNVDAAGNIADDDDDEDEDDDDDEDNDD